MTPKHSAKEPKGGAGEPSQPSALKGEALESNVIQLKGGGITPMGGGIRTPVKLVAPKGEPNASPASPSNATPIESPRIVSQINGMYDSSYGLTNSGTNAGTVMYDAAAGKRKRFVVLLLVCALVAALVAAFVYPKERDRAWRSVVDFKEDVVGMVRYKKKKKPKGGDASDEEGQFVVDADKAARPARQAPPVAVGGKKTCKFLVQQGVGRGVKLSLAEQVDLAECYLVQDDLISAENALSAAEPKIQRMSEKELNAMKADRTLVDAYFDLLVARMRAGKLREAGEMIRNRCNTWAQTNTCVAKIMLLADRRTPNGGEGTQVMFGSAGRLDAKAQARLWLAGAQIAITDGRASVADQRYAMALNTVPRGAVALRKQIYEAQGFDLYTRGETVRLKNSMASAFSDLTRQQVPVKSLIKLQVFRELANVTPKTRYKTVKSILTREDITFKARGDFDLIEVLGPESIRAGVEEDYLRLLKRTRDFYQSKYKTLGLVEKRLTMWEVRANMARERYEAVLPLLDQLERQGSGDPTTHHLRGSVFLAMAERGQQITAASEFQAALRIRRNWESLYALGVTLTRAGKSEQVAPLIKDLDKMITTNGQRYWVEMLKAEWYIEKGKYLNAQKILTDWQKKEETYVVPRQILMKLYKKLGKQEEMNETEAELVKLGRTQRPIATFEGFASPLGVMALARRPID